MFVSFGLHRALHSSQLYSWKLKMETDKEAKLSMCLMIRFYRNLGFLERLWEGRIQGFRILAKCSFLNVLLSYHNL